MGKFFTYIPLTLILAALPTPARLQAQGAQVRAKVSEELPRYTPSVTLEGGLELPGTDAIADLGDEWNRAFMQFQPQGRINYVPKLTREAVQDLQDGKRPMIITAREMSAEEIQAFQAKFGYQPMRIPVCLDATIVFVHKNNPLSSITMEQLDAIFSKDLRGGAKAPISLWSDLKVKGDLGKRAIQAYSRQEGATRDSFKKAVLLGGEFRTGVIPRPDTASLSDSVIKDEAGIAFGSLASWYAGVKVLPLKPYQATDSLAPNQDNVTSGRYPMARLYYAYVNRAPDHTLDPAVKEFLQFILSSDGQGIVADVGILPAPAKFLTVALARLAR